MLLFFLSGQIILNGLIQGILYSLMAVGFALVYNTTKVFHIAAAGIWAFASYMYFVFSTYLNLLPIVSIGFSVVICMALSLLIDFSVYRPLYRRRAVPSVAMIASIGVLKIIDSLSKISSTLMGWDTMSPKPYKGFDIVVHFSESDIELSPLLIGGMIAVVFLLFLKNSGLGVRLRAMGSDEDLYALMGYNPMKTRTIAFILSGLFIALSSCLFVGKGGGGVVMDEVESLDFFVYALASMIIGGTGSYGACVVGGLFVGIIENVINGNHLSPWIGLAIFGLLILTLLFRPQGLVGRKQRSV